MPVAVPGERRDALAGLHAERDERLRELLRAPFAIAIGITVDVAFNAPRHDLGGAEMPRGVRKQRGHGEGHVHHLAKQRHRHKESSPRLLLFKECGSESAVRGKPAAAVKLLKQSASGPAARHASAATRPARLTCRAASSAAGADLQYRLIVRRSTCRFPQALQACPGLWRHFPKLFPPPTKTRSRSLAARLSRVCRPRRST